MHLARTVAPEFLRAGAVRGYGQSFTVSALDREMIDITEAPTPEQTARMVFADELDGLDVEQQNVQLCVIVDRLLTRACQAETHAARAAHVAECKALDAVRGDRESLYRAKEKFDMREKELEVLEWRDAKHRADIEELTEKLKRARMRTAIWREVARK